MDVLLEKLNQLNGIKAVAYAKDMAVIVIGESEKQIVSRFEKTGVVVL